MWIMTKLAKQARLSGVCKSVATLVAVMAGAMSPLALRAATPALPAAVDGVVTLANQNYVLTETDDLTGITEFKTTGGWLVFDISENESLDVPAKITGTGGIEKRGLGTLNLTCNIGNTDYKTTRGLHAVAGELHLPMKGAGEPEFGIINIDKDAIVFVSGHNTYQNIRTLFTDLTGSGLLTNGWNAPQVIQQAQGTTSTNFSGVIGGSFNNFWIYPSSNVHLTNTNNTFKVIGSVPGFGKLYLTKIGYGTNDFSSVGQTTWFDLGANGGDNTAGLYFMGTNGETTVKKLCFSPWSGGSTSKKSILDAGSVGGLVWNGEFAFTKVSMVWAILQGEGPITNVFGGTMTESAGSSYLEKRGASTWRINGRNSRKGVVDVKEGTLQFESLRDKGRTSSLGLSSFTHSAYHGAIDNSRAVPYAFVLGGGAKGESTLECVGWEGNSVENQASDRPLVLAGAGRLKTTCPQPFAIQGVSTIAASPCTLVLDGTNTASAIIDATNGVSALSIAKEGPGTWVLRGEQSFSGSLAVKEGTLIVEAPEVPYSWYKFTMKTVNSYYSKNSDTCRVTHEFALYDADGVRRNKDLVSNTSQIPTALSPGEATVAADQIPGYYNWAFTDASFKLSRMFDDNGGTASYLAGRKNGTSEDYWISVVMRLPADSPEITSFDMISTAGEWNKSNRRTVAYSVSGSTDGRIWDVLSEQTTNETARFTSGWYSNGDAFTANEVRQLPDKGIAIAPHRVAPATAQLANVSGVSVAAGATLEARGAVTLRALSVDASGAGNGTVRGFAFASSGVLDVKGLPQFVGRLDVPFAFDGCTGLGNVSNWTIKIDGVPTEKYIAYLSSSGVAIIARGMTVIFK